MGTVDELGKNGDSTLPSGGEAKAGQRICAGAIDVGISIAGIVIIGLVGGLIHLWQPWIISLVCVWMISLVAVDIVGSTTLGKYAMQLRIARLNGSRPLIAQLIVRATIRRLWLWPMLIGTAIAILHDDDVVLRSVPLVLAFVAGFLLNAIGYFVALTSDGPSLADRVASTTVLQGVEFAPEQSPAFHVIVRE